MAEQMNLSGKGDHIVVQGNTALIMDYKTGRGDVTTSERNLQLMSLAVLVKANHKEVTKVYAAIIQPHREPELVCYDTKQLKAARAFIFSIVEMAFMDMAHRVAGEKQCRWCKVKATCPEALAATLTLTHSESSGALADPAQFAQLLDYVGVAKKMIPAIEAKAREALEANPDAIDGYQLKSGIRRRELPEIELAFEALKRDGLIDAAHFMGACKVSLTSLEKGVKECNGMTGREAKEALTGSLDGLVNESEGTPRLHKNNE